MGAHVRDVERVGAVVLDDVPTEQGKGSVEVEERVRGVGKVVALAGADERDDRDALLDGGVDLEEAPRAAEHLLGLEDHEGVRVRDVGKHGAEVAEVVCGCVGGEA